MRFIAVLALLCAAGCYDDGRYRCEAGILWKKPDISAPIYVKTTHHYMKEDK